MPKAGTTLWMYDSSGNESQVGELTSVAWSPAISSPIALAYLHRSVVLSAEVFVRLDNVPSNADNTLKYDRREAVKMRGVVEQLPMGCATGKGINQGA
jgi:glycine cleavage system aminomethyltransferase T